VEVIDKWKDIEIDFIKSGLTPKEFCKLKELNINVFYNNIKVKKALKINRKKQDKRKEAFEKEIIKQAEKEGFNLGHEIASAQKRHLILSQKLEKLIDTNLAKADGVLTDHYTLESYIRMLQKLSNSTKTIAEYIKEDGTKEDNDITIKFDIPEPSTKKINS
jgi:hypothetical protein